ncbi:hypothetical protein ACFLZ1_02190 [Patescibacteria group bacterium]
MINLKSFCKNSTCWQKGIFFSILILLLIFLYYIVPLLFWPEKICSQSSWLQADTTKCHDESYVLLRGVYSLLTFWWLGLIIFGIITAIGFAVDKILKAWNETI